MNARMIFMPFFALVAVVTLAPAFATEGGLPNSAKPADASAVVKLYAGKTWRWSDGAGYFAPNQQFLAWSGKGDAQSYIDGKWFTTKLGTLCFRGVWHATKGAAESQTCFEHRVDRNGVYQRKMPDGPWYVFKHEQPDASDEYDKLSAGDLVTADLSRIKSKLKQ